MLLGYHSQPLHPLLLFLGSPAVPGKYTQHVVTSQHRTDSIKSVKDSEQNACLPRDKLLSPAMLSRRLLGAHPGRLHHLTCRQSLVQQLLSAEPAHMSDRQATGFLILTVATFLPLSQLFQIPSFPPPCPPSFPCFC